jgi:predicted solute-binding protein
MERKECNAEGKTSACQKTSFTSAMYYKMLTKIIYISNVIILKNEEIFSKMTFFRKLKKYF